VEATLMMLLTFVAVALGVVAGYSLLTDLFLMDQEQVRRRVDEEFRTRRLDQARRSPLFKNLDQLHLGRPGEPPPADLEWVLPADDGERSLAARWQVWLEQSALPIRPRDLLGLAAAAGFALGLLGLAAQGWLLGLAGLALGAGAPLLYVHLRRARRRHQFLTQLPEAFDLMARVLRSGHSVPQALQAVADTFEDPIAGEFACCQEQQNLGLMPETTYRDLARRTALLEVRIFVMAMLIQRQTGGNLSEVLERLAGLVRDRLRLRGQIRTLTAEGRLQALVLLLLPPLVFAALFLLNRKYAEVLLDRPGLLAGAAGSMAVGVVWIRAIINNIDA
jgi:tight adherence protein B